MNKENERNSSIELLRIIVMFLIIGHHLAYHSSLNFPVQSLGLNKSFINLLFMGGKIGSNVFILISGYFLINQHKFKMKKIIELWITILFYSVSIYLISSIFINNNFSYIGLFKSFFPIITSQWWFASCYFIVYLLSPYINKLINSISKKELQILILLFFVFWSLIPTLFGIKLQFSELGWLIYLYIIGAYIKLYNPLEKISFSKCVLLSIALYGTIFISSVVIDYAGLYILSIADKSRHFFAMESVPILFVSIMLLLSAIKCKTFNSKIINKISSTTFAIYLIHENSNIIDFLWNKFIIFTDKSIINSLILNSLLYIAIIFVFCSIIEFIRVNTIGKLMKTFIYNKVVE